MSSGIPNQRQGVLRLRSGDNGDGRLVRRLVTKRERQTQSQEQRKNEYPEDDFSFPRHFKHAGTEQVPEAGPAAVMRRCRRSRCRLERSFEWGLLGDAHGSNYSSRKCRPVKFTNTSSRLAWRVVRCSSCAENRSTCSSSAGIVRCGSRTLRHTLPSSSRTDSTPGSDRHAPLSPCELPDSANSTM